MKKEQFEWIHSWQDENFNKDLPRILLIGDSITHNYQNKVREKLKGIAYVDYVATSYGIDSAIYKNLVLNFANYNKYDLIHFNFGLHAKHLSKLEYKKRVKHVVQKLQEICPVIIAKSTVVYCFNNIELDKSWMKRVNERNIAVEEIANELNIEIDDLFDVSCSVPKEFRYEDGTHYLTAGYEVLANQVVNIIIKKI